MGLFSRRDRYDDTDLDYNNGTHNSGIRGDGVHHDGSYGTGTGTGTGTTHNVVGTHGSGLRNDGVRGDGGLVHDGSRHDGLRNEGLRNDGIRNDGLRNDGIRNDGLARDGVRNDGLVHDGVRNDGHRHSGLRNDGYRNDDYAQNNGITNTAGHRRSQHQPRGSGGRGFTFFRRHGNTNRDKRLGSHHEKHRAKRAAFDIDSGVYNRRPSFGQWLKMTWLDILTMVIMGMIGLGVYEADPAPSRSFPITFRDGEIVYPEFAYPLRNEIVPIWAAAMLGSLVPIVVILFMQIRIRSFWDVNNAIIGLLYSLISAAVFQVFVKWLIGGLRPHFLTVCDPDPNLVSSSIGSGYGGIMFGRNICRGDRNQINDSLESMPSGHSTAAWAGFLYLYFYLNAKMKVFSNHHPAMWKLIALYAPLLGATLITGALTIDEFHNWYDCLAGAVIGSVMAISAYRMVYASVWDFRFNHIPLTRHTPFSYGAGQAGAGGFESAVFTRKAGWGFEEAYGGAPFDAAHGLRGQTLGFNTGAQGRHGGAGLLGHGHGHERGRELNQGSGLGHHNDGIGRHNDGVVRNDVGGVGTTSGYAHDRDINNRHSGLRDGDVEHNAANINNPTVHNNVTTTGGHVPHHGTSNSLGRNDGGLVGDRTGGVTTSRDAGYGHTRSTTPPRDARYGQHSRSLERKALPAGNRVSGEY